MIKDRHPLLIGSVQTTEQKIASINGMIKRSARGHKFFQYRNWLRQQKKILEKSK